MRGSKESTAPKCHSFNSKDTESFHKANIVHWWNCTELLLRGENLERALWVRIQAAGRASDIGEQTSNYLWRMILERLAAPEYCFRVKNRVIRIHLNQDKNKNFNGILKGHAYSALRGHISQERWRGRGQNSSVRLLIRPRTLFCLLFAKLGA